MSKVKEVKEASKDKFAEINNKAFNDKREKFLKDFRKANSVEMIKRLWDFLMVTDQIDITENGLYGFGAFAKSFFEGPQAPGQTGLEVYATEQFAKQYTKEYLANNFTALLKGTLKDKEEKPAKESSGNDFKDKE